RWLDDERLPDHFAHGDLRGEMRFSVEITPDRSGCGGTKVIGMWWHLAHYRSRRCHESHTSIQTRIEPRGYVPDASVDQTQVGRSRREDVGRTGFLWFSAHWNGSWAVVTGTTRHLDSCTTAELVDSA